MAQRQESAWTVCRHLVTAFPAMRFQCRLQTVLLLIYLKNFYLFSSASKCHASCREAWLVSICHRSTGSGWKFQVYTRDKDPLSSLTSFLSLVYICPLSCQTSSRSQSTWALQLLHNQLPSPALVILQNQQALSLLTAERRNTHLFLNEEWCYLLDTWKRGLKTSRICFTNYSFQGAVLSVSLGALSSTPFSHCSLCLS